MLLTITYRFNSGGRLCVQTKTDPHMVEEMLNQVLCCIYKVFEKKVVIFLKKFHS